MDLVNKPSSSHGDKYNVFLSFYRGEDDPEFSFPSQLHVRLKLAGISVLKGDVSLELLLGSIECSKISIVIISKHIASSRRCLKELTKIMEFRRVKGQVVVPIFYGVNPSDICNQEFSFGQAFQDFIQRVSPAEDEVSRWRAALSEAGSICGFYLHPHRRSTTNLRNQSTVIEKIVDIVRYSEGLFDKDGLVGVSSRALEVITMLLNHPSDVVSIGIWGMGGSGKTTLAKLIYDHFGCLFDTTCFLSNVREAWERKGKVYLQKQLLSVICTGTDLTTVGVESATLKLNRNRCKKKVLLVLDDVNHLEQLRALCTNNWFGVGSKIIITTRDLDVLHAFGLNNIHTMKLLSDQESLHLFGRKAFEQSSPNDGGQSIELCKRMVAYSEGLPLALQVFGSYFSGRFPIEWNSALMNLLTDLPPQIYDSLKLSFDSLNGSEREIFINIVLFHIGEDRNDVFEKVCPHTCFPLTAMEVLEQQGLITIDKNNKLRMHNMLRLMGRQIMRESSQNELRNRGHKYDVFLSFRGKDTRTTFTSHLYSALCNAGIDVFKDDVKLLRGNHIKIELFQAIGSSKIAVIIFSKEYARSKWCLEELSLIMELHKSNGQVVLPVFYNVDPSEIRNQTSSFGEAFQDLAQIISPQEDQVSNWRSTLTKAGGIAGFVVLKSRDESERVKDIVKNVCDILDKKDLFVADHPVGVDNRVQEVITMLQNHQSQDVVMVGIWGMGGIGKTTIAKAIYNEIGHTFESRSYLPNIRDVWGQEEGQVRLQNQLLHEICKTTKLKITSTDAGKIMLCERLRHKTALIVLDDVDELVQLHALAGNRDWFKPGSKIFITTRNQRLLLKMNCHVYMMKNLNEGESIELFSWHAFEQESPKEDFTKLSRDIVAYSGGLPLALEVFGSYLLGREMEEWKSVLEKLKKIPNDQIQEKLKISFDGLDDLEKEIFLDISCFFIGMERNEVTQVLNGCGFFADIGIKTLIERSLITINEKNTLIGMHDLLRDMGREIVRKQSQKEFGKRSRLWFHEDALAVLLKHVGTEAIEGLSMKSQSEKMSFQTEAFRIMKRLRLLHLKDVQLTGNYECISTDLKWLCWHGFPKKHIPNNLHQEELVVIDLQYSSLRQVWKKTPLLKRLKILNVSHSPYLVQTPDFSHLPNLEKLILKGCLSLSVIHHSIELLNKLFLLDLEDCIGLHSLPRSIYRLKCLKTLILSGCVLIEKLEEDIEQMKSLTTLVAPTIKQVPFSLVRLRGILYLSVRGHEGLSHHVIPSLYKSWVSPTNNPLPLIPTHAGMPSSILWDMLDSIQGPSTIPNRGGKQQSLLMEDGSEIEIPNSLCATNCMEISRLEQGLGHLLILIGKNSQVFHTLSERISQGLTLTKYNDDCILPGDNHPYWLAFKDEGTAVKFKVPPPPNGCDYLKGMTICSVYTPSGDLDNKAGECCIVSLMIINYTKATTLDYMEDKLNSLEEVKRKKIISNLEFNDQMEVRAIFRNGFTVKKTIVYLIYNESFDEQMEHSQSEATNFSGTKHRYQEEVEAHQSTRSKPRKAMRI